MPWSLQEIQQRISNREFNARIRFLKRQWDAPDRTDYYLMQIAGQIAHIMSKRSWSLDDMKIKFQHGEKKPNLEQQVADSKARWRIRAGLPPRRQKYGR
jgi:hypothetical protein